MRLRSIIATVSALPALALGVPAAASAATAPSVTAPVASAPVSSAPASTPVAASGGSCTAGGPTVWSPLGQQHNTVYCPTWRGTNVYGYHVTGEASQVTGYLYGATNWFACQQQGAENPGFGMGYKNTYWLLTQGDVATGVNSEYIHAWGWIPATAVSYGGDYEPIPGVPFCSFS